MIVDWYWFIFWSFFYKSNRFSFRMSWFHEFVDEMIIHIIFDEMFLLLIVTNDKFVMKSKMSRNSKNFENNVFFDLIFLKFATLQCIVTFDKFMIIIVIVVEKYYDTMIFTILIRISHEICCDSFSKKRLFFVVNRSLFLILSKTKSL